MDTETRKPITVYYYGEVVADCVAEFKNNQVNPIILSKIADLFLFVQDPQQYPDVNYPI